MDSARPAPSSMGALGMTLTKILRLRRTTTGSGGGVAGIGPDNDGEIHKVKFSKTLEEFSALLSKSPVGDSNKEAMEALLANLFARISAVKAAYAQLQVAQSPYDPDTIQSADRTVVSQLKHLSELKHSYLKNHLEPDDLPPAKAQPTLEAQIQEQGNLLKTYQITTKKLEKDLQLKDSEALSLQAELLEIEKQNRSREAKLHPHSSLSTLDNLHISGLNPTHFLTVLRYTVKSIRSFVKLMEKEMKSAGWDLDAAAGSIQPDLLRWNKPEHRTFAFESYVCQNMFSDFHLSDFSLRSFEGRSKWDRQRFFEEFSEVKSLQVKQFLDRKSEWGMFCRAKYLNIVHPKMEASFFGDLDQRALVSTGQGFPDTEFFLVFAEMARRVWLLHCFFFSFAPETQGSIFQARRGCRFSEVFMESVAEDENAGGVGPTVGFTVVPGFRVGRTVIQCKVYMTSGRLVDRRRS